MPHYVYPPSTPWQLPPPGWPPSGQSRVVFLFFFCLPRILLHFYSCWRACFAAIASFAAMSWPCCMWYACLPACQRGEAVAGTMRVKMYTLHLNHSGKLLLASSLYLSAAIYLSLQSALGFSHSPLPLPPLLPPTAAKHWQLQVACNFFFFFGGCKSKL